MATALSIGRLNINQFLIAVNQERILEIVHTALFEFEFQLFPFQELRTMRSIVTETYQKLGGNIRDSLHSITYTGTSSSLHVHYY